MYEYKVVIYKEGTLNTMSSQNIKSSKFERILNQYASEGWKLKDVEKDSQKGFFGGKREAYVIIFERKIQ